MIPLRWRWVPQWRDGYWREISQVAPDPVPFPERFHLFRWCRLWR